MPIYGYRCESCGHELEVLQSVSAERLRVCPECGGGLRKLLYPAGIVFKGSGFYSTDYKKGSGASAGSGHSGDSAPAGEGSSGDKAPAAEGSPSSGSTAQKEGKASSGSGPSSGDRAAAS
ncbi:MAG: FmdB family zinc ribbon protein [Candidatus Dormibacterales bacterium]